jgi:hypothetical protein
MCMVYTRTKSQMPSSYGLLVITIKPKDEYRLQAASILLFYILQKITKTKARYFSKICYHTSFPPTCMNHVCIIDSMKLNSMGLA